MPLKLSYQQYSCVLCGRWSLLYSKLIRYSIYVLSLDIIIGQCIVSIRLYFCVLVLLLGIFFLCANKYSSGMDMSLYVVVVHVHKYVISLYIYFLDDGIHSHITMMHHFYGQLVDSFINIKHHHQCINLSRQMECNGSPSPWSHNETSNNLYINTPNNNTA